MSAPMTPHPPHPPSPSTHDTTPSRHATPETGGGEGGKRYKDTLNLPKTAFPMKANLVQNEPASLKRWAAMDLYRKVREARAGSPRFVFHDGPPYANASIHLGHLMNKCLKDFVVRSKGMMGLDCPYIPGWDCHGLPIEHKVMTDLVEAGKADKLKTLEEGARRMAVRRECQKHAEKFVKLHTQQMTRLLTLADYANPYLTMAPAYEGATLEVLAALMEQGLVYRALKPVHWSIANETALAEAELEYYDREDVSVYVDFEAEDAGAVYDAFGLERESETARQRVSETGEDGSDGEEGEDGADENDEPSARPSQRPTFMIWTTTPWTLPANLAIAVNPDIVYALVRVDGNITVMAEDAVERVTKMAKAEEVRVLARTKGFELVGLRYRHPFVDVRAGEGVGAGEQPLDGGREASPGLPGPVFTVVAADYVTLEDGTGLVHTAPGHGVEDYQTGLRAGLPIYSPVRGDGTYDATVPEWLRAVSVWDANTTIVEHLRDSGHLFFDHRFTHSYPHDWRSKTPVIFRCTEQWFVGVDQEIRHQGTEASRHQAGVARGGDVGETLRAMALREIGSDGSVTFVPEWGRNRLRGMLEARPDWCISRQRAWGLPIPAFTLPDGSTFMTAASIRAVARLIREKGSDIWFTATPQDLLKYYDPATDLDLPHSVTPSLRLSVTSLTKGPDILDVWFESGSSWNAVMRERSGGRDFPSDLYLEGSDQHRGWFQTSLLPALGMMGAPPYRTILTHGFMVAKDGRKLSKSSGDTVEGLFSDYGVDVLRWWVASLSYENDVKVDREFFDLAGESYRKVRNTLRFMLSNLYDYGGEASRDRGIEASSRSTALDPADFPPTSLDAWVLAEYDALARDVIAAYDRYEFRTVHARIYDFCNTILSAVYLAAVKDRLYCDRPDSPRRRRTQATLHALTDALCRLLAPVLPHTADEAFRALWKAEAADAGRCVHLEEFVHGMGV